MKNLRTKVLSAVLAVSVLGASAVAFTGCGNKDTTNDSKVTLTNVSYDPTRELYEHITKSLQSIGKKKQDRMLKLPSHTAVRVNRLLRLQTVLRRML